MPIPLLAAGAAGGTAATAGGAAAGTGFLSALGGGQGLSGAIQGIAQNSTSPVTSVLGAIQGIGGLVKSAVQNKRAQEVFPAFRDPRIEEQLNRIRARRRSFQTGSAFQPAFDRIEESSKGTLQQVTKRARNLGEALTAAGKVDRSQLNAFAQLFSQGQQQSDQLLQQEVGLEQNQSQRELDLRLLLNARAEAKAQKNLATAQDNIGNAVVRLFERGPGAQNQQGQPVVNTQQTVPFINTPQPGNDSIGDFVPFDENLA